ncbi:MAG: 1-acyl-sn-glycerol-3-phosphate acyltransferase [Peptococcaceae bacterium]|nr:1-acyl-sn-glycerol-3-phosphate acyltransferase [Peptococcaceae bacterium]
MLNYKTIKALGSALLRTLYRIDIKHTGPIPETGPLIICSNHIHNFDPVVVAMGVKREIRFMAKAEMFSWPVLGYLAKQGRAFPVKRGGADIQAIKQAIQILKADEVLGIFPEGTRSKTGEMKELNQGVVMLAERTGAVILPAAIVGEYKFRRRVTIVFGSTVALKDLCPGEKFDRTLATINLMQIIQALKESVA